MEEKLYLQNLEEYVFDENKVVTYRWLSLDLQVPANHAKQMLYEFVQHKRNESSKDVLHVVYLVIGNLKSADELYSNNINMEIVPEEDWDACKEKYSTIMSRHIYSVQQTPLKDSSLLYQAQYEKIKENIFNSSKFSGIQNSEVILKEKPERAVPVKTEPRTNQSTRAPPSSKSTSAPKKAAGGISAMFSKAPNKPKKEEATKPKEEVKGQPKKGGLKNMFAKQAQAKQPTPSTTDKKKKSSPPDDEDIPQRKRRRVREIIESSSEDEDVDMEESPVPSPTAMAMEEQEEEKGAHFVPDTPENKPKSSPSKKEDPTVITETQESEIATGSRKGRKRVKRQKQSLDEDGYMVTETVWESTDCSSGEEEETRSKKVESKTKPEESTVNKKAPASRTVNKKLAKAAASKQTNMMNFFKKK